MANSTQAATQDKITVEFTRQQLEVVFDILNVYAEMGCDEFLKDADAACNITMKALAELNKAKLR
jgi:hypothetical protein